MIIRNTVRSLVRPGTPAKRAGGRAIAAVAVGTLIAVAGSSSAYAVSPQRGESVRSANVGALAAPFYLLNGGGRYLAPSGNLLIVSPSVGASRQFSSITDGSFFSLQNQSTGLNVNTQGNGTANGTRAVLSPGSGSSTQDWTMLPFQGGPQFRLQSRAATSPKRCLGVSGGSSGTDVAIFDCAVATNQLWQKAPI